LYVPLAEYLIDGAGGFPAGSFHMKSVPKNLAEPSTWEDLHKLLDDSATYKQKVEQISALLTNFPNRRFILIGDSGEKDPEVYAKIRETFGAQVQEIRIRDVVNDREKNPARLAGMTIIDPATGETMVARGLE
jgi:phosphatidate phosphatase APP1